jgi:hypothetical protein
MGRAENVIIRHISDQISRRLSSDHLIKKPTICLNSKARERDTRPYGVMLSHNRLATLVVANVSRLTRSVAFLSKLVAADVEIRFVDFPAIEGATGRFMLHQMASVAEREAGMISDRTRKALAAAKARGVKLGGFRGSAGNVRRHCEGSAGSISEGCGPCRIIGAPSYPASTQKAACRSERSPLH